MRFMQIESVLQTINRSEPAKNRFSVALVNRIGLSLTRKSVDRLTDRLDMTIVVDWDVKQQNKQTKQINYR